MKYHHIIVCGYPRAGTTLFYNMLRTTVKNYKFYNRETKATDAHKREPKVPKITKRPTDITDAKEIDSKIPNKKFIVCIRDPRSILVSEHAHAPGHFKIGWDYAIATNRKKGIVGKAPGLLQRHKKVLQVPDPIFIYYEDLVTDPVSIQKMLKKELGFKYKGYFTDFYKHDIPEQLKLQLNGVREVSQDRIDSWKNYPERIKQQFNECPKLFEIVKYWGYEKDDSWFDRL